MDFNLNNREFWEAIKLRYDWEITDMPTVCVCEDPFSVDHAMICWRGGFIYHPAPQRAPWSWGRNVKHCLSWRWHWTGAARCNRRNATQQHKQGSRCPCPCSGILGEAELCIPWRSRISPQCRLIQRPKPWADLPPAWERKETHVCQTGHRGWTRYLYPFSLHYNGGMGEECQRFHSRLAELIAAKKGEQYSTTISWIRTKVSFAISQSALLCLRGSRTTRRSFKNLNETDFENW